MAEPHPGAHAGPSFQAYITVFVVLTICTGLSFLANAVMGQGQGSMFIILIVALVKAVLVAMIFMHLKFDWCKVYFIIVPVLILGVMLMIVLLPDIVLGWHHQPPDPP